MGAFLLVLRRLQNCLFIQNYRPLDSVGSQNGDWPDKKESEGASWIYKKF